MFSSKLLNFFPTPKFLKFSYVGMRINQRTLHYIELRNDERGLRLGRYGEKAIESSPDFFSNESLKSALREIIKKEKIEFIKLALPEEETYLFKVAVEGKTQEEIRSNIEFQLEENVPISGNDAIFEFNLLPGEIGEKKEAVVSVVSKQTISKYYDFFKEFNIIPVSFVAESNSLSRAVVKKEDQETSIIVNLSGQRTVCAVVSRGLVQFSSIVNAGSFLMTDALRKHYNLSIEDAEKMKEEKGIVRDEENEGTFSILANAVSVLRDEIERVSIYWRTHHDKDSKWPIKKIILVGKDAVIPGLADYLSASLKIDVHIADIWCNLPRYKREVPPIKHKDSLSYGTSIGLSL